MDTINSNTQNSPDLLPKFRSLKTTPLNVTSPEAPSLRIRYWGINSSNGSGIREAEECSFRCISRFPPRCDAMRDSESRPNRVHLFVPKTSLVRKKPRNQPPRRPTHGLFSLYSINLKGENYRLRELAPAARWSQDAGSRNLVFTF